ncbi:MAG: ABC transporter ATP-binding protein [Actinobacteria bacterium]|nr:ABC transporter ATP-binding protein [Actinomycetota bacterium]
MTVGARPASDRAAPAQDSLLQVESLRLGYWGRRGFELAVADVSFDVQPREKCVLIGPSGCGKSTLLKAVAGFVPLAGGSIRMAGRDTLKPGPDRAVVFQEFDQLFPWRTVLDNVAYPLRVNGARRPEAAEKARSFLELTGLERALDRYPHQLSGGMKQRVAIARALALEPVILLMDEPFGSLDALTRARLQRELNEIVARTDVTVLFVTHSIDEALVVGDRVVVLANAPSTVQEVADVREVGTPDSAAYAEMRRHLRRLLAAAGEEVDEDAVFV